MTDTTSAATTTEHRERVFLFRMALFSLAIVLFGFIGMVVVGRSSVAVPWFYHAHAVPLMAWILLVVVQSWLAKEGNFSLHKRLGWLGAGLGLVIVAFGVVFPVISGAYRVTIGTPPVPGYAAFLILNIFNFIQIGVWLLVGFIWRERTDLHRRAMHIVTLLIVLVAWNRVLEIIGFRGELQAALTQVALIAHFIIYMIGDKRIRGRIHPAYYWGLGAFCLEYLCYLTVGDTFLGEAMLRAIAP